MIFFSPLFIFSFSFHFSIFFFLLGFAPTAPTANNNFVTDNSFSSVFGNQDQQSSKCFTSEVDIKRGVTDHLLHEGAFTRLRDSVHFRFLFLPSLLVNLSLPLSVVELLRPFL